MVPWNASFEKGSSGSLNICFVIFIILDKKVFAFIIQFCKLENFVNKIEKVMRKIRL